MPPPSSVMPVRPMLVSAFALKHRGAAVEDEFGRAAHADQLRAVLQAQHAGAIDARRQRQRHLRPRGLIDRALQDPGLVVGTAGPHAILRGVAPERRGQRRRARGIRGDIASAPATPAAEAPIRWRRLTSMIAFSGARMARPHARSNAEIRPGRVKPRGAE